MLLSVKNRKRRRNKMAVVGIDLGTTYSEVAVLDEMKKPVIVPNSEANNTTPSVVFFEDEKNVVAGEHEELFRSLSWECSSIRQEPYGLRRRRAQLDFPWRNLWP
jgi:hypothetical protein